MGTLHQHYKLLDKKLGEGQFASVRLGESLKTGEFVAIKCVDKKKLDEQDLASLFTETEIMREINHKNVLRLFDYYDETFSFFMVTEYLEGGELFDRITLKESYSENDAVEVVSIIADALQYCHNKGIVHRDLKPENLLLVSRADDTSLKIADFGLAAEIKPNSKGLYTPCGTPGYCAPEIVRGLAYDASVDMWSVGVITFILLGGYPPFYHRDPKQLLRLVVKGEYEFKKEWWSGISSDAKNFISQLLILNPQARLTAKQALRHPWILKTAKRKKVVNLGKAQERLNEYQIERKLRTAMGALSVVSRLMSVKE